MKGNICTDKSSLKRKTQSLKLLLSIFYFKIFCIVISFSVAFYYVSVERTVLNNANIMKSRMLEEELELILCSLVGNFYMGVDKKLGNQSSLEYNKIHGVLEYFSVFTFRLLTRCTLISHSHVWLM